jgi:hypothetical protein
MIRAVALTAIEFSGEADLMKAVGWPEKTFANKKELAAKVHALPASKAVAIAMLSSCCDDLPVFQYSRKPECLEAAAMAFGVQTAAIRKVVAAELAAKAKKPAAKKAVAKKAGRP